MTDFQNLDKGLDQAFQNLDPVLKQKYQASIQKYKKIIIPFQMKRIKQNQSLSYKNNTLQRDRRQLTRKIENIKAEKQRILYVAQRQEQKIKQLQKSIQNLAKTNSQNMNVIQVLRFTGQQLENQINQKSQIVKQVEAEKKKVLEEYQNKNNEYNTLLSDYMKDKNEIAQKLNLMNQIEQNLFMRQKNLKQQQLYLKKQWQQFQQSKKNPKNQRPKIFKKPDSKQQQKLKERYQKDQILKNPLKKIIKHHTSQINDITFNYYGNLFGTCGGDHMIKIYDISNFQVTSTIQTHTESIPLCLSLNYTGQRLLVGSTDKTVTLFSVEGQKELHSYLGHGYKVNCVSWTCQKEKFISGSEDKQIKIWDLQKASNLYSISCGKIVKCLTTNVTDPLFFSGHSDGSVRVYSLNQSNSTPVAQIRGIIDYPINSVVALTDRNQILVSSQQGSPIHILDLKMNKSVSKFEAKQFFNTTARAQLSPSEKYVVAGNCDGYIYYWNRERKAFEKKISGHDASITAMKYNQNSGYLVSCDKDGSIIVWQQN